MGTDTTSDVASNSQAKDSDQLPGALAGIRVIDATQMLSGPICTMRLGDLGADIIKIEPPDSGEWVRDKRLADISISGESVSLVALNRNKRSVTINLKHPRGLELCHSLVATADVFIQNYRAGAADRLGVGYDDLKKVNERLVYCSITGYGERGPGADRPGQDLVLQGYSGSMWSVGRRSDPPTPNALWAADAMTGYQAGIGILAALLARGRSGRGQKVEVSMLATVMDCQAQELTVYLNSGLLPERTEERSAHALLPAPYGVYETADAYLTLAHVPFAVLADIVEDDRLRAFDDFADGIEHRDVITRIVADNLKRRSTTEWLEIMWRARVWAGPVYTYADLVSDPQVVAGGLIETVTGDGGEAYRTPACPIRLSDTPTSTRLTPPALGAHTEAVLRDVGIDDQELAALRREGAI